jgi:hypothetical protein
MPRRLKPQALSDRPPQTPLGGWSESAKPLNSKTVAPSPPWSLAIAEILRAFRMVATSAFSPLWNISSIKSARIGFRPATRVVARRTHARAGTLG